MKNNEKSYKFASYKDLLKKTEEGLADSKESQVLEIPIDELYEFKNHPFRVLDDEKMDEMVESVKANGVIVPGTARKRPEGGYEIISGHRRHRACELAGVKTMPMIVRELSDDIATIIMVDANIQREKILISEKAKAYRQKYEAGKHQGIAGGYALDEIGNQAGESRKQIQRYIWLSRLNDELLSLVDEEKLGFVQGIDISFLTEEEQAWVLLEIKMKELNVSSKQSDALKKLSKEHMLNFEMVQEILSKKEAYTRKFSMSEKKLSQYFDKRYSTAEIESIIYELLDNWKKGR